MFHGFPGMDGFGPSRRRKVDNDRYYEILGVDKDAHPSTIKKAYRKLAMTHHPDKGGDEERFKEITTAFGVLSDEEKRQIYDEYGEEGLRDGGGASDVQDLFSAMFRGGHTSRGPKKGEPVIHSLNVTLEDLYKGKMSKLAIIRNRVCKLCHGIGATSPSGVVRCSTCQGRGFTITLNQIGPGMVQQVQNQCRACKGMCEIIHDAYRCSTCDGEKVVKERKVLEVYVDKGMQDGQKITFTGEANANPGLVAGDVIVVLKEAKHAQFTRKGNNLIYDKRISLTDALCGVNFFIKQLDGRMLHVRSPPDAVIKPDMIKSIPGEGMPTWRNPMDRGYMFVKFTIDFPDRVSPYHVRDLEAILGNRTPVPLPSLRDEVEEVSMISFDKDHLQQSRANGSAYDEDEHENPTVQCGQV